MPDQSSTGVRFRQAIAAEKPLQIVGTINAYCAILAEKAGHNALYLSGAGVANASLGCRIWEYSHAARTNSFWKILPSPHSWSCLSGKNGTY